MTADRTTKTLMVLIAMALWGLLLRPVFAPTPAQAQGKGKVEYMVLAEGSGVFSKDLDAAAAKGWRAKGITAMGRNGSQAVVLMERQR